MRDGYTRQTQPETLEELMKSFLEERKQQDVFTEHVGDRQVLAIRLD